MTKHESYCYYYVMPLQCSVSVIKHDELVHCTYQQCVNL